MRRRAEECLAAVLAAALAFTRVTAAEPLAPAGAAGAPSAREPVASRIEVERGPGAEACPDAAAVFRSIARLFPERSFRESPEDTPAAASARVVIRALPTGYEAVLSMRAPHPGERVIGERDPECAGLADALGLAFVLLVEPPEANASPQPASSAASSSASPMRPPTSAPAGPPRATAPRPRTPEPSGAADSTRGPTPRGAPTFTGNVAASGIGGFGLLSRPAGGAALGVELVHTSGWGGSLAGVRLWSPPSEARGGSVRLSLWALAGGPCYVRRLRGASSLDACVRLGAGSQHANVEGFLSSRSPSVPWLIAMPALGYRLEAAGVLTGFVRVGPLVQLLPQSFSADDGSGRRIQVAGAPNVGVVAELGVLTGDLVF